MKRSTKVSKFMFRGLHGRSAWCGLEIIRLSDGRTVVIATERKDNPGASITNVAETLASYVCDCFAIDPGKLVWIEHYEYGYPPTGSTMRARSYDLVAFKRRSPIRSNNSLAFADRHPDGWHDHSRHPMATHERGRLARDRH